jgi:anti-sigma factor RsiW
MSDQASPEDLMRYFNGEASEEERERVCRSLVTCGGLQEEMNLLEG